MPASWVYILRCADGSYYTGCTTNFDQRMGQHHAGSVRCYTQTRRPLELVWVGEYQSIHDAIAVERKLKRWSHDKKTAFINGDLTSLRRLSERRKPHVRGSRRASSERFSP